MNLREGTRRMGIVSNWLMTLSLLLLVAWWRVSAALFVLSWLLYGAAYLIAGFLETGPPTRTLEPSRLRFPQAS